MRDPKGKRPTWVRFSGMGFEFAAAVIGFTLAGYWIGLHSGHELAGLLVGAALGIVGGGYNLLRASLRAVKQAERERDSGEQDGGKQ